MPYTKGKESKGPKYLHLAEIAYRAHYDGQPQIQFRNLSHEYQMGWVRMVRDIIGAYLEDNRGRPTKGNGKAKEDGDFWGEINSTPPRAFLDKWVPKFGSRGYAWNKLPKDRRIAAQRLHWRLRSQAKRDQASVV
jgi:hypothetical protein